MIKKKVVYCEIGFLHEFLNSYPILEPNDESLKLVEAWMSFYQFFSKADIILNITVGEFKTLTNNNPWLNRLWKKSTEGLCGLDFDKVNFPNISSLKGNEASEIELNAVFLTTKDTEECESKSRELGVFVFNPEMAKRCTHLFCDNGTAFPDENAKDWDFIKALNGSNMKPPINISNSMLIIDNYLLCDDEDIDYQKKLDYNLKPILKNLLPTKLADGVTYDITVFVSAKEIVPNLYDGQYNYLNTLINNIRKNLNYRLAIFIGKADDKFHDRSIVTNNVLINSGYGFGILRKNGKTHSPTSVNIAFPFFQTKISWADISYLNIMSTAKKIVSRLHEPNNNCWGDDKEINRLLSYYVPEKKETTKNISNITFNSIDESHRNGRLIGKIDLSKIKDFKYRDYKRG